jgi:methylmalonyl-CoA mutase, N-terminal domain
MAHTGEARRPEGQRPEAARRVDQAAAKKAPTLRDATTLDGIGVKPVYGPADLAGFDYARDLGDPGEYPFTRGIHPHMYRARLFTMRQYIGFGTPRETNARFKYLMAHGQDALNVAFDLPTQLGLDSDDPRAEGEVGRVGMAVDSLLDMEEAFDGIPADRVSISFTINSMAAFIQAMFLVVAEKQGVAWDRVVTTPQNDILKEFVARGTWVYPVDPSLRLVCDIAEFCARHAPKVNPISICGYHIREAGATPAQEMAYGLAIAAAYIERLAARGLDVDSFAPRLSFNFTCWGRLFEEVAKFRAGRRLYARIMKERFAARDPKSMMFRSLIGGGGSAFTVQEPENNIVRGAYYALAAALSGAQTMALPTYDEAYTIPSPKAQLLALRTMQICAEETGVADTVDPLAGSYFVEALTTEMEGKIREEMANVDRLGGVVEAVKSGALQAEVARQAYRFEQAMVDGRYPKVAVNRHIAPDAEREVSAALELYAFDPAVAEAQIGRLARLRRERDQTAVDRALARLRDAARGAENLMPVVLEAARAYSTLGEMAGALRAVWGEHKEPLVF